jgi:hypothetical protein
MVHWEIPHDETHRFLRWDLRDHVFESWCDYFDKKGVKYEVGGGRDSWTIYKHILHTEIEDKKITRCCPTEDDL